MTGPTKTRTFPADDSDGGILGIRLRNISQKTRFQPYYTVQLLKRFLQELFEIITWGEHIYIM
jgi:hypothetical protein